MFTLMAQRRRNLAKDKKAPQLHKMTETMEEKTTGPIDQTNDIMSKVETKPSPPKAPAPQMDPKDHGIAAGLHKSLATLYSKYTKPAGDTIPHTEGLNPAEKTALGPEIDMERP